MHWVGVLPPLLKLLLIGNLTYSPVVLYGVKESPPKALRHKRLQSDIKAILEIFGGIDIQLNPAHILDCFRLKQTQSRPRLILIKLQCVIDIPMLFWQTRHLYPLHFWLNLT